MDREPKPQQEINIDPKKLSALLDVLLQESASYNIDCLDLKEQIAQVVIDWCHDKRVELEDCFKDFYPQTFPAKKELMDRLGAILSVDRIHVKGSEPEFRRTKILDHWAGEIYYNILGEIFSPSRG